MVYDIMAGYIKSISFNLSVIDSLLKGGYDRLGEFIVFELVEHPNASISAIRTFAWFKHILVLLGYPYEHICDLSFDNSEMAECWVRVSDERMVVIHKYWSLKQCKACLDLMKTLGALHNIPVTIIEGEK